MNTLNTNTQLKQFLNFIDSPESRTSEIYGTSSPIDAVYASAWDEAAAREQDNKKPEYK